MSKTILGFAALVGLAVAQPAAAGYYVARDNFATAAGSPNPNFGRLTFLFGHGDHFHSIGRFGAAEGQLPEAYIGGRVELQPGTGAFAGRYVSGAYLDPDSPASEYSDLAIRSIQTLAGFPAGSPEAVLLNSSSGRWATLPLGGAVPTLELVSISPGLQVGSADGTGLIGSPGERLTLGAGESFAFTPRFVTAFGAAPGTEYTARFRLVDARSTGTPLGESGTFRFEFQAADVAVVPAPSGLAALALGAPALLGFARRRLSAAGGLAAG